MTHIRANTRKLRHSVKYCHSRLFQPYQDVPYVEPTPTQTLTESATAMRDRADFQCGCGRRWRYVDESWKLVIFSA